MKSGEVSVVRMPFLVPRWAVAQVLFPDRILVRRGARLSRRLLAHELVHVEQMRTLGILRYWWTYLVLLMRFGYREHPMEFDAVVRSAESRFLERAERLMQRLERSRSERRLSSGRTADIG